MSDGGRLETRANSYTPGVGWGDAVVLDRDASTTGSLEVAAGGGTAIAAWQRLEGARRDVIAWRYGGRGLGAGGADRA